MTLFQIRRDHNNYLLLDQHLRPVDSETLALVIQELSRTLQLVTQGPGTQEALTHRTAQETAQAIAASATWYLPPEVNKARGLGGGVYFIKHASMPGLAKIGMTASFRQRMRTLKDELPRENRFREKAQLKILAFVETPHYKLFETDLHLLFADSRVRGEWFQDGPILTFIEQFKVHP